MSNTSRGTFTSRLGFVLSAAGSAIGLGNIWAFPSLTASNGGAAFVLVYIILSFILAYPALVAELIIGRHSHTHPIAALKAVSPKSTKNLAVIVGICALFSATLILSFYSIVAGWMLSFMVASISDAAHLTKVSHWLTQASISRNLVFTLIFMAMTLFVVIGGVKKGIEKYSSYLMPLLFLILIGLILYVLTLDGAMQGLEVYLIPDPSRLLNPDLLIAALGQAFFAMSLGAAVMMTYGSYIKKNENVPKLAFQVAALNISMAFLAGFLIIPCMYVAMQYGVKIFDDNGSLLSATTLVFQVLPSLFEHMGHAGTLVGVLFFVLMSIAALTSSISMLEAPTCYLVDGFKMQRKWAATLVTSVSLGFSVLIIFNFSTLFELVIQVITQYMQPLLSLVFCLYVGWLWNRHSLLKEICQNDPEMEKTWFWKIWPWHIKWVCPGLILLLIVQQWL